MAEPEGLRHAAIAWLEQRTFDRQIPLSRDEIADFEAKLKGAGDAATVKWDDAVAALAHVVPRHELEAALDLLGVRMDVYSSEKALYGTGRIEAAIDRLSSAGLIYEGTLEPPKGKLADDWEPREQTLFRSTSYGDDVDRPVRKSDGRW